MENKDINKENELKKQRVKQIVIINFFVDIFMLTFIIFLPQSIRDYFNFNNLGITQQHLYITAVIFYIMSIITLLGIVKKYKKTIKKDTMENKKEIYEKY